MVIKMKQSFYDGNMKIQFDLVFRTRKTLEIQINPAGRVRVVAPKGVSDRFILDCLRKRSPWIRKHIHEMEVRAALIPKRDYIEREIFYFLGEQLRLQLLENENLSKPRVWVKEIPLAGTGESNCLMVETPVSQQPVIQTALEKWYKQEALRVFAERINYYGEKIGKRPERIKLSNARKRWGSCTAQKTILLNWRIIMAPPRVLDYLVVHELCHLAHLNHSPRFWRLVSKILPGFQAERDWLRKNGYRLVL